MNFGPYIVEENKECISYLSQNNLFRSMNHVNTMNCCDFRNDSPTNYRHFYKAKYCGYDMMYNLCHKHTQKFLEVKDKEMCKELRIDFYKDIKEISMSLKHIAQSIEKFHLIKELEALVPLAIQKYREKSYKIEEKEGKTEISSL